MENGKSREAGHTVVLIDGVCNLCQGLVRFIIPRDPKGRIKFASLQSDKGRELLLAAGLETDRLDTVVLLENGRVYIESSAVLRIAGKLRFPWPAAYVFVIVPRPLRNVLYKVVARNRYRWFGRDEACLLPSPDIKSRFL
ncbi:thiol-disulfide oxidoreductase DCC family protein [Paenibacillus sp. FSL R7-0345]|uniref:thiol-disulfide oxidoreductase DCC family protein n=1 Tax=Paenibacillus sp. FSL R7-0345 TaxID=2954535 RepID=UPI00315B31B0